MNTLERYRAVSLPRVRRVLVEWRKRHPPTRTVQPLPAWMHTEPVTRILTNYEAQRQAEWDRAYS